MTRKKDLLEFCNIWPIEKTLLIVIGQTVLAKLAEQPTSDPKFEGSNPTTNVTRRNNNVQKDLIESSWALLKVID
jgi:hypothetical protein